MPKISNGSTSNASPEQFAISRNRSGIGNLSAVASAKAERNSQIEEAGSRIRTDDLLITNQLLYQLSYAGIYEGK